MPVLSLAICPARQVCGVCRSRLEVLSGPARGPANPKAGGAGEDGGRTPLKGFPAFVKVRSSKRKAGTLPAPAWRVTLPFP
jgi:hypothetical protein